MTDSALLLLPWLTTSAFVLVAALAFREWLTHRDRARGTLAAALGLLAVVMATGRVSSVTDTALPIFTYVTVVAFMASGYALVEHRATILPLSRAWRVATLTALAAATAVALFIFGPGTTGEMTSAQSMAVNAIVLVWAACVLEPTIRLWRASASQSPIRRMRLRSLAAGYGGILVVLFLALALSRPIGAHPSLQLGIQLLVVSLTLLLYAAVAPPFRLRQRWLRQAGALTTAKHVQMGTWYWDLAANSVGMSRELQRLLGGPGNGIASDPEGYLQHIHPDDRERVATLVTEHMRMQEPCSFDHRFMKQDGAVGWMHVTMEVTADPASGETTALVGTAQDVTDRKQAEQALQDSQAQLKEAQRLARIGSWHWNVDDNSLSYSDQLIEICGMPIGMDNARLETLMDLIHPDDHPRLEELARLNSPDQTAFDVRIVRPDGEIRWLHVQSAALVDDDGRVYAHHGTAQDVTERKSTEAAIRSSEDRFRALVESAPDAVLVVNADGEITLANDQTCKLFGYEDDELVGRSVEILLPAHARVAHRHHRESFGDQPSRRTMGQNLDLWALRKDGTQFPVDVSLSPVETPDGLQVVAAVRDNTQRKQSEKALQLALDRERDAAEQLRALDRMKDTFLEAVSHELRTPLTTVIGMAETLVRKNGELAPGAAALLAERIAANGHRLERLLSDLLDLDRITRGVLEPNRRPTDIAELVRTMLVHVDLNGHPVEMDIDEAVVCVGRAQVERIVENLLVNAIRHTPPGTPIWLRVRRVPDGVRIAVDDAGVGVPEELKANVFEPFQRGEGSIARSRGTGIGLSLVARFAELHGGGAWVEERPGGGASFNVFLRADASDGQLAS